MTQGVTSLLIINSFYIFFLELNSTLPSKLTGKSYDETSEENDLSVLPLITPGIVYIFDGCHTLVSCGIYVGNRMFIATKDLSSRENLIAFLGYIPDAMGPFSARIRMKKIHRKIGLFKLFVSSSIQLHRSTLIMSLKILIVFLLYMTSLKIRSHHPSRQVFE